MTGSDKSRRASGILEPHTGEVLGCKLGFSESQVALLWPGGQWHELRDGERSYTLTQEAGISSVPLHHAFRFIEGELVSITLKSIQNGADGLGRHRFNQLLRELQRELPAKPFMQDEGYLEYDVASTRVVCDVLDATIRFEELP